MFILSLGSSIQYGIVIYSIWHRLHGVVLGDIYTHGYTDVHACPCVCVLGLGLGLLFEVVEL